MQYKKLLEESYKLSHSNRKESDKKRAEAEEILNQIESLTKND
ncbi:Lacal_2735 family protein [Fulvivirga maritima]|nr:Lacal_2735 family protein [Fulvivirga maritima]UII29552.1 Lacal_2735 family protein [Fulvivirga maritima]